MTAHDSDPETDPDSDLETAPETDADAMDSQATETDPVSAADTLDEAGEIGEKMARVREIIDQLEDGEVSLERARELRDEGKTLLADVEDDLDLGDASVIERE